MIISKEINNFLKHLRLFRWSSRVSSCICFQTKIYNRFNKFSWILRVYQKYSIVFQRKFRIFHNLTVHNFNSVKMKMKINIEYIFNQIKEFLKQMVFQRSSKCDNFLRKFKNFLIIRMEFGNKFRKTLSYSKNNLAKQITKNFFLLIIVRMIDYNILWLIFF